MLSLPEKAYIYGLRDPRIPDVVWYVGKTNNPYNRLQYHLKDAKATRKPTPVQKWISRLQAEGVKPVLSTLAECPFSEWKQTEREFISQYRKKNLLLINKMDGGNGTGVKGRKEFCDDCGTKRIHLFPSDGSFRCPVCRPKQRRTYEKQWNARNVSQQKEYAAKYYQDNKIELSLKSEEYYHKNIDKIIEWRNGRKDIQAQNDKIRNKRLRDRRLAARLCVRCGITPSRERFQSCLNCAVEWSSRRRLNHPSQRSMY